MNIQRKEDGPDYRNRFPTERMFQSGVQWFFYTREGTTEGPYSSRTEAARGLEAFISQLNMRLSPAYYELSVEA